MSALGQKQTSAWRSLMSALLPKADIAELEENVRFVPKADIMQCNTLIRSLRRRGAALKSEHPGQESLQS
jgi:hypothetical protein